MLVRILIPSPPARDDGYHLYMQAHFMVVIDSHGAIASCEAGEPEDVPSEVAEIAHALLRNGVVHSTFIWMPEGSVEACSIAVSQAPSAPGSPSSVYLHGTWLRALPHGLTNRELDVVTLLAFGLTSSSIAERLVIAERTVTTHIDRVLRKLNVSSRTAAAVLAIDEGIVRLPFPGGDGEVLELLKLGRSIRGAGKSQDSAPKTIRQPLVIGAALPLRGTAAADGLEMVRASELAIEEINQRGGIDGRSVRLELVSVDIFDTTGVQRGLATLAERGADVITSGYLARQDLAHEFMADSGIPYLHAATLDVMAQLVRDDPARYGRIFQVCASDLNYAPRFLEMMTLLRDRRQWVPSSRRLVVVEAAWSDSDLGLGVASILAEQNGWQLDIVHVESDGAESWARLADQLRTEEPAAIMVGNYLVDDTVAFLSRFLEDPSDTLVYSLYSPSVPEFRERMAGSADGLLWATVTGTYSDGHARAFVSKYRDRFGVTPGRSHAGISYDRVALIARAWSSVSNPRDPKLVSNQLRQTIHRGVNGVYYFENASQSAQTYPGETTDPSLAQAHLVFQIQNGRQRILDPAPYADGTFVPPPWLTRTWSALGVTRP